MKKATAARPEYQIKVLLIISGVGLRTHCDFALLSKTAMAWKRGVQNNPAGEIRKGHIKEFQQKSSKATGVVGKLHIVSMASIPSLQTAFGESYFALISSLSNDLPPQFVDHISNNVLLLHAHQHPRVVLTALLHPDVPPGSIVMNEIQCLNSKVCTGEFEVSSVAFSCVK